MSEYIVTDTELIAVASAIIEKNDASSTLEWPTDFISAINDIEVGIDTSDADAMEGDILSGKTAYVNGEKIEGTIPTKTSTDVTLTGVTLNVPVGYYGTAVQKTISSVTLTAPSSGTTSFSITVPNGVSDPVTFTFNVDTSGNTTVNGTADSITWATGGNY